MSTVKATQRKPKAARVEKSPEEKAVAIKLRDEARFIIGKFVHPEKVDWARDMKIVYKLLNKYPELSFWKQLECKKPASSCAVLITDEAKKRLKEKYRLFQYRTGLDKRIVLPEKKIFPVCEQRFGDDYTPQKRKPRTVVEFLK